MKSQAAKEFVEHDKYPTRVNEEWALIRREVPVVYSKSKSHSYNVQGYKKNGYDFLRGALAKDELSGILDNIGDDVFSVLEPSGTQKRSLLGVHSLPGVEAIADQLSVIAKHILGEEVYIHQSRVNLKAPNGTGWSTHSDFETWHAQDGMPEMRAVTFMMPLTDNMADNGPLKLYRGSHMCFYSAPRLNMSFSAEDNFADQKSGVVPPELARSMFGEPEAAILSVGDVAIFDCNTLHESSENKSGRARTNLFLVFNAASNQLSRPFSYDEPRPEEMGTRSINKIY